MASLKPSITRSKLLLAIKAALAVGIAWVVAPLMPGVVDEYPYYAPLGALLSMHSTLKGSAKYGLQILAGLATGIILAAIVLFVGAPNVLTISLVVAVGVVIGTMRWLGAPGQEYLPIAALFVLIVGGQDASGYAIGYLVQMIVGIAVGLLVNLLVLPPLTFDSAVQKFSHFRRSLSKHLNDVGTALTESWPPTREDWASQNESLAAAAAEVRETIHLANDSRKGNPRARIHNRNLDADYEDLAALENVTFHIRDLTEVLAGAVWGKPFPVELPTALCAPLSEAVLAVAEVLTAWEDESDAQKAVTRAGTKIEALLGEIDEHRTAGPGPMSAAAAIAMALQRILVTIRVRMDELAESTTA